MTMTEEKPAWGIVQTPLPEDALVVYGAGIMRVAVRCTGTRRNGLMCNAILCKVDIARWEETCTDAREDVCDHCGKVYTLADYR